MQAKQILLPLFLLFSCFAFSQADSSTVRFINPSSVAAPKGYSHVAQVDLGNCRMIIMSGQVALDKQGNLVGKDNFEQQAEQVFSNIRNIIKAVGGTTNDIVKLGYYIIDASNIQTLRNVRDKFINTKNPPASTLVQVSKLFRDDVLLEVEATAIIPKK